MVPCPFWLANAQGGGVLPIALHLQFWRWLW